MIELVLVLKKKYIFGKKRFFIRVKFYEKGRIYEIFIECKDNFNGLEFEMEVRVDGYLVIYVKNL